MSYEEIKKQEMLWAEKVVSDLNNSTDKYVVYKTSRPITDIRHMLRTSTELYGDNVAFRQRFEKNEPYREITYKEAFETVNALGTALTNIGLKGKRIAVIGENCYQWATSYLAVICGTGSFSSDVYKKVQRNLQRDEDLGRYRYRDTCGSYRRR